MMPTKRRAAWTIAAILIAVAGCCRDGPTHKCDFTPPAQGGADGGSDAPVMCGTEICEVPKVCCVTKAPLNATCVDLGQFEALRCEKMALPCLKPDECPGGLACCVALKPDGTGTVTCMQEVLCVAGEMTFVACGSEADCPAVRPACISIGSTPQGDFKVCQ